MTVTPYVGAIVVYNFAPMPTDGRRGDPTAGFDPAPGIVLQTGPGNRVRLRLLSEYDNDVIWALYAAAGGPCSWHWPDAPTAG